MNVGDIISGPFFPETIELKKYEAFGEEYTLLEGIGRKSNQYYEQLLTSTDLEKLTVISKSDESKNELTGVSVQQRLLHVILELEDRYWSTLDDIREL